MAPSAHLDEIVTTHQCANNILRCFVPHDRVLSQSFYYWPADTA